MAALAILSFTSCDKLKHLTDINKDIEYKETVDLPGIPGGDTVVPAGGLAADLPAYSIATNSKQYLAEYNTDAKLVTHVKLKSLTATLLQPSSQNFNFLDTLRLYVSATGQPEKLAAYKYGIAKGQNTIEMDVVDFNLKEYFLQDSMYFRINGHFNGIPDSTSKIELKSVFNLLANPLN